MEAYKKALSIDPGNTNFKQNLAIAESQLGGSGSGNTGAAGNPFAGLVGGPNGLDLNAALSNPMFQNMAQQLMSNPQMQNTWAFVIRIANSSLACPGTILWETVPVLTPTT